MEATMAELQARAQAWSRRSTGLLLAGGLLALAACAPKQAAPVIVAPPPPVEAPKPAPPKPGEVHKIAILVPLTGPNSPVGISLANAASLALADSKRTGIRLTSYDTAALGAGGAASRAMADGAELILGPLLAGDVAAARAVAAPRGVTMLSFSNDTAVAGNGVYLLGFQPSQSVARVVDYASGRGMTRFAGLIPNGIYGQRAAVAFTRAVAAKGGQIVALTNFTRDRAALPAAARTVTDYDARLKKAGGAARQPDGTVAPIAQTLPPVAFEALLVADSGTIAGAFAPQLARYGAPTGSFLMMGTELWNTEPGLKDAPALRGAVFAAVPDQRFQAMARRYRARYGSAPSRLASLAYDAMLLAASGADAGWAYGNPFPAKLLQDPQGFVGIDGIFRFKDHIAERGLEVQQVGPQGFTTVSPAPSGF